MSSQAGLVANFLTYPWKDASNNPFDSSDNSKGSMGERVKAALIRWSYQRLPDEEVANKAMSERGWNTWQGTFPIPDRVNVAYNSKSLTLTSIAMQWSQTLHLRLSGFVDCVC